MPTEEIFHKKNHLMQLLYGFSSRFTFLVSQLAKPAYKRTQFLDIVSLSRAVIKNKSVKMPSHSEFDDAKNKEKMLQEWLDQNQYTRYSSHKNKTTFNLEEAS